MAAPVFHLEPMGRLGNQMIEYMVAKTFIAKVPGARISNISIPAWGIHHPVLDSPGPVGVEHREQHIDLPALADQAISGQIARVEWKGFGQRMENFLPAERYQDVFVSPFDRMMGYGPDYLVCPVRAEDILSAPHPDYVLTPVEFYRELLATTGLRPVFLGQTHRSVYMDRIRAAFPKAIVRDPQSDPLVDFETIRQSRNVVVGVSTFAWLAAWLSRTAENIFMTVNGLFNPMQNPQVNLLPFGDARYRFFLFPINHAVPLERHPDLHRRIEPYWRQMPHEALRQLLDAAPRFPRRVEDALAVFDPEFYLRTNADVAEVAQRMGPDYAHAHYAGFGFNEGRLPLRFDENWYVAQYPLAAFELGQGDCANAVHHYWAIGKARGYRAFPAPDES